MEHHLEELGGGLAPMLNQCEFHPECQYAALRASCAARGVTFMGYMPFGAAASCCRGSWMRVSLD